MNNEEKILAILMQMQTDITDLKADVTTLKSEQALMRADIADLKSDVTTLKADVKALHDKMDKGFQATRSEIVDVVEAVSHKVERLEDAIKSVEDVAAQNAFDVQLMKRRA